MSSSTTTQSTTTKITKIVTTSSTWDEISNESVGSAGVPLAIEQAGEFFTDQTSNTRKVFDQAVQDVVKEVKSTSKEDDFKTYQQLKDKELAGTDRAGSIAEEDDKYKIIVDMKGFSSKDLKVTFINENELVVEGERETVTPDGAYSKQSFKRRFTLPGQSIIKDATSAFSSDNILTITVPKVTKDVSEKIVTETKELFKKDVQKTDQVQTVVASEQKPQPVAQPAANEVQIIVCGSFFTDKFFESVRKEFQTKVKEIVERRIKKETTEESVYKSMREPDTKENAVISVVGESQDHKVVVDVHGYSAKDLKLLKVTEYELTIQGRVEKKTNNSYCATSFKRSFTLPSYVDIHNTVAALSDEGVLTIVVPKKGDPAPDVASQTTVVKKVTTKTTTIKTGEGATTDSTDKVVSTDTQVTKNIVTDQQAVEPQDDAQTTKTVTTTKTTKIIKKEGEEEVIPIEQSQPQVQPQPAVDAPQDADDSEVRRTVTTTKTTKIIKKEGEEEVVPIEQSQPQQQTQPQPQSQPQPQQQVTTVSTDNKDTQQVDISNTETSDTTKIIKKTTTKKTSTTTKTQEGDEEPVVDNKETFDTQTETQVVGGNQDVPDDQESDTTQKTVKKVTKTTITKRTIHQEGDEEEYEDDDQPVPESQQTKTVVQQQDTTTKKVTTEDKVVPIEVKGKFLQDSTFDQTKKQIQTVVKDTVDKKTVTDTTKQVEQTQDQKSQDTKTTKTSTSQIIEDTTTYKIVIDVFGYVEKEITIKISGDEISVEGKSEIKKGGCMSRKSFKKSFQVPSYVSINEANSALSSDGVLTLTMPIKPGSSDVARTTDESTTTQQNVQQTTNVVQQQNQTVQQQQDVNVQKSTQQNVEQTTKVVQQQQVQKNVEQTTNVVQQQQQVQKNVEQTTNVVQQQQQVQKNVEQTKNVVQQQDVQTTTSNTNQQDPNLPQVPIQPKGDFYEDTFFKDTIEIFETALVNTLSRFQDDASNTTTKKDPSFYKELRDKEVSSQTEAEGEDNQFHKIVIDVKGYKSSDLKLKVVEDNGLTVEGRVEERSGGRMSSKSFKKSFWLTDEFSMSKATAGLSADGILSIKVPRTA